MGDTLEQVIIKELNKGEKTTTNGLIERLEKHGFLSKKTIGKRLESLEKNGIIIRSKYRGKGYKRFIQLKPIIRDKERDIKKFEKYLDEILKLVKYKVKKDKSWDPIKESIELINERFISHLLLYRLLEPKAVRRYVFLEYYELLDRFFDRLSKLLYKEGYFKKEETEKQLIAFEERNSDFLSKSILSK